MFDRSIPSSVNQFPAATRALSENHFDGKVQEAKNSSGDESKAELKKVAQQFEAIFIAQLLKVMRETIQESGLTEGGFGKSIYTEMFDQEVALDMARRGTLGISNLLFQNFSAAAELSEKKSGNTPASEFKPQDPAPSHASPKEGERSQLSECQISDIHLPVHAPVSSAFGLRKDPLSQQMRFHKGVDFAAPAGMKVTAPLPGKVVSAGYEKGYGNTIIMQHTDGLQTRYGHLASINVKAGDVITAESALGTVGNTGHSTGPHLHFEVIRMGVPVNPILSSSYARLGQESGNPKAGD
jgi:murein DD-endopeptidase MepM/ murein hydrolase activator NlpD